MRPEDLLKRTMKRCMCFLLWALQLLLMSRANATSSSDVVDARLVNGDRRCVGHLEMKHRGQWRTLMLAPGFSSARGSFSEIACRQMGCGSVASFHFQVNTTVPRPAWEVHFPCGKEPTIRECREVASHQRVADIKSTLSSTAVECSENLKLASYSSCSGRVKVKSGQDWVHVCKSENSGDDWQMVKMMCMELGCGRVLDFQHSSLGEAVESSIIHCHGNETETKECAASAHSNCDRVLNIVCQKPRSVRLVGESRCSGLLEAKNKGEWRPLVPNWFSFSSVQLWLICRTLDCGSVMSYQYRVQRYPVWEVDHSCDHEDYLHCRRWGDRENDMILNVVCSESLRLGRGPERCSGQVEVRHGGAWQSLCLDQFSLVHSFIGCRELGCGYPRLSPSRRSHVQINSTLMVNCSGDEERITDCPVSSPAEGALRSCDAAFLSCGRYPVAPVMTMFSRLAVVEQKVLVAYSGHRVLVTCSIDSPARVRSFHLHKDHNPKMNLTAVDNSAQFDFGEVEGHHKGTYHCMYDYELGPNVFSESTSFSLDVKDSSYVRLVGQRSRCLGILELQHEGKWRPVSQRQWGLKEAAVVCKQLNCGSAIRSDSHSTELQPVWMFSSDCNGSERALLSCGSVTEWMSFDTVRVLCSDILAPPNIDVLADRFYPENTERVVVRQGRGFFLNCSVEPWFPGGRFSLMNSADKQAEAKSDYWAVFKFSNVYDRHNGNYSCVYHSRIFQHNFTFQSQAIIIAVEELGEVKLDDGLRRNDGSKACSGTLLMKNGTSQMRMVAAESSGWDMRHASIVCRDLDCGNAIATSKIHFQTFKSTWRFFSDCEGSELALLMCGHIDEWFSTSAVQVVCAGRS